jgi:hypothetical protein
MARKGQRGAGAEGSVRLLIFSGRPDPEWTVGASELEELVGLLKGVVGGEPIHPPPAGGLGYRGFLVRGAPLGQRPADVTVFRGVITEQAGARAAHWRDTRGIERWLLDQARKKGHGQLLEAEGIEQ